MSQDIGAGIGDLGGAASDIFGGIEAAQGDTIKAEGLETESSDYSEAAVLAGQNAEFTEQSTAVQQYQAHRTLEKAQGATSAEVAGAGFTNQGSAQDILRNNAQQGAIQKQIIGQQGLITEAGYTEQQATDTALAAYTASAAQQESSLGNLAEIGGAVGGALKIGAAAVMFA